MSHPQHTERTIGLGGTLMTLVGFLIGASIYILPGQLAAQVGPGVLLSYLLGGIMAFFTCLVAAQVGCVVCRSGGSFHAISSLVSPTAGFVVLVLILIAVFLATALVAYGFANYLSAYFPGISKLGFALTIILLFGGINVLGTHFSVLSQTIMTLLFLTVTAIFFVTGIFKMDTTRLTPFMPLGLGATLSAMIPAYFSWTGFTVLIELGGEIKDPGRNIPRSLLIGFVIILVFYLGVCLALVGNIPWQELGDSNAPITDAAQLILPTWLANLVTLMALLAAATSINGMVLAYSRDIYAMAKTRLLPESLAQLTDRHAIPARAVVVFTALSLAATLVGAKITDYAIVVVMSVMIIQIALAVAALRIPSRMAAEYYASSFRIPVPLLRICCVIVILSSLAFLAIGMWDSLSKGVLVAAALLMAWVYYRWRLSFLAKPGQGPISET